LLVQLNFLCFSFRPDAKAGQQQRRENGNDGDNHQQLKSA